MNKIAGDEVNNEADSKALLGHSDCSKGSQGSGIASAQVMFMTSSLLISIAREWIIWDLDFS